MIGQEEFDKFAKANGIEYESGTPTPRDRCGTEYDTFMCRTGVFEQRLLEYLWDNKYVIVRMYPHYADYKNNDWTRMRLTVYREKP
jgi:hypothetical protein